MSGMNTRIERRVGWRRLALLFGLLVQLAGWALPNTAHAQTKYYGAPFTNNWDHGSYASAGTAAAAYINGVSAGCNVQMAPSTCVYTPIYYDPNTNGALAALVRLDFRSPSGVITKGGYSPNITATPHYEDAMKVAGGPLICPCATSHEGDSTGGSSPHGSSGDSALDAQPSGAGATFEADPINAATGNKYEQDTDFRGSAWLTFRRFYNSKNSVVATHLGPQWRHSFDRALEIQRSAVGSGGISVILVDRPDGAREQFTLTQGAWVAQADNPDTLVEQDDVNGNPVSYLLTLAATRQTESYFPDGRLNVIHDLRTNQDVITTTYSTAATPTTIAPQPNLLITVTDTSGRTLNFTYDSAANLHTVTVPDGGVLTYAYDAATGNLLSVQYPDGKTRQYVYNEASLNSGTSQPHALTGIIDETNSRFESTGYQSGGNAYTSSFAGNVDTVTLSYPSILINGAVPAKITTPLGTSVTLNFMNILGADKPASNSAACGTQCNESLKASTYDANGYPQSMTDFNGNVTKTTYDANGLLGQEIDASGTTIQRTTNTTWNTALRVPLTRVVLNASSATVASTAWAYNTRGQATAQCEIDPIVSGATSYTCGSVANALTGVRQTRTTYCDAVDNTQCPLVGLPLTVDGPRTDVSDVTAFSYYLTDSETAKHGDLKSVTDALGHTTTILSYDGAGRVLSAQDANGVTTTYTYYPRGWLHNRTVGGATTTITYTPYGAVQTVTDPDNITVTYGYDAAHRLTDITDAQGNHIHYTLDASGNRTAENTYASGSTTPARSLTRNFNTLGQLTKIIDGLNHTVFDASATGNYDGNGNLVQSKDALNIARKQGYDALNRLSQTIDNYNGTDTATKNTTSGFGYDALDRLTGVTDPSSLTTTYGYDGLGNRISLQSPDTGSSSDTYDAAGNRRVHTDAKGIVSTTAYDALNRPISTSYSDSAQTNDNVTYAYDEANSVTGCSASYPVGRLTRVIESAVTTVYCYDARGNTTLKQQIIGANTDTTSYSYTSADRLSTLTEPSGSLITYGHDSVGRVNSVAVTPTGGGATTAVSSVSYLPFGPVSGYTLGNGQVVTRTYDANYALSDLISPALNLHFARDLMGNIYAEGNAPGANPAAENYGYDPLYRLKSVAQGTTTIQSFTYNPTGDRTSKTSSGLATGTYGYQANTHWLTSIGSAARSYDANGNTTGNSSAGQTWGYGYNGRNRLTVVQAGGSTVGTYTYNAIGQRIAKTATLPQAVSERYNYEGSQLIGEYGTTNRDYVWLGDIPVATVDTAGSASTFNYVTADHLDTPRAITNSAGTTIWSWPYVGNAFGELAPTSTTGYTLNLRLAGQYYDAESGAVYNLNRDYDPTTGRYVESDPVGLSGGQLSTYAYVSGDPLSYADPLGLRPGDHYHTLDQAGEQALQDIVGLSIRLGKEFGGVLYKNDDGTYSYTVPEPGTDHNVTIPFSDSPPAVGWYHTHGADDPGWDNEDFSDADQSITDSRHIPGYLETPRHAMKVYQPGGRVRVICNGDK